MLKGKHTHTTRPELMHFSALGVSVCLLMEVNENVQHEEVKQNDTKTIRMEG